MRREGGCLCGAVRFAARDEPVRASACHCRNCQRRTGSAFGIGAYFREADVELRGELKTYEYRSDESGRWLRTLFCPACGTTVSWTAEAFPGIRALAGGAFDDPGSLAVQRHGWTRSRLQCVAFPPGAEVFEKSALQPPQR